MGAPSSAGTLRGRAPSPLARGLRHARTAPVLAGAGALYTVSPELRMPVAGALAAYGATIVAFLGGLHWGLAARGNGAGAQYAWGVLPSLLAWGALLLPDRPGLYVLAAGLVACYLVDRRVLPAQGLGGWMPLRALLTVIAAGSCLVGALAV